MQSPSSLSAISTPSSSVRSWEEYERSSVDSHDAARGGRTLYVHDPYSFTCFTYITPEETHQSNDSPSSDLDEVLNNSAEEQDCGALVIADMGKLGTLIVAKKLLKDETGRARTPCGHTKRQRLRHKGHIAYFTCCECSTKYREIGPQKIRDDQRKFLLNGGLPVFV